MKHQSQMLIERSQGFSGIVYHGTGARFKEFKASAARVINDYYGGGIAYFTDSLKIAISYSKKDNKNLDNRFVYTVQLRLKKIFDVDDIFSGKKLLEIVPNNDIEKFARGANLLSIGVDKYKVIADLKSGRVSLTGDQVFKGLSRGQTSTAGTREHLKKMGYDGLRYNGGLTSANIGIKHNVYLAYYPSSIEIKKVQRVRPKKR